MAIGSFLCMVARLFANAIYCCFIILLSLFLVVLFYSCFFFYFSFFLLFYSSILLGPVISYINLLFFFSRLTESRLLQQRVYLGGFPDSLANSIGLLVQRHGREF